MLVKSLASVFVLAASASMAIARPVANPEVGEIEFVRRQEEVGGEAAPTAATDVAVSIESVPSATEPASPAPAAEPSVTIAAAPESAPSTQPDVVVTGQTPAGGAPTTTGGETQTKAGGTPPAAPPATASGAPTTPGPATDLFVLNYALTLEHLESTFYKNALAKFSAADFQTAGFDPAIRDQFLTVQSHEDTHVTTLTSVIEATFGAGNAVPACEYNFNFDTVSGFIATAAALERTGVQAYTGAVKFISTDAVKTAGAAIATVEGRHSAILNAISTIKVNGVTNNVNPIPAPFDTPLGFTPVFSIAAPFIKSCPFALPVVPFPSLSLATPIGKFGDNIGLLFTATLTDAQLTTPGALQCAFLFGLAQKRSPVTITTDRATGGMLANCQTPDATGFQELMVFITNADRDVTLSDDAHVIAGPTTFTVLEKTKVSVKTA
ncbi:hypothetical protein HDU86_004833 [Geranomyces michiganensis]|nr:hypothetical protein HDU86_004833 [Geranomyces michiganensis]